MTKRKISLEVPRGVRNVSRKSSSMNLRQKTSNLEHRQLGSAKMSQTVDPASILISPENREQLTGRSGHEKSKLTVANASQDIPVPKTRFNGHEKSSDPKSSSSPRLKNFPAEKVKKLETGYQFFPRSAVTLAQQDSQLVDFPQNRNNGHGDAFSHVQTLKMPQHDQNASASQQQMRHAHQISNNGIQSEVVLSSQSATAPADRQVHRPFVPNATQGVVVHSPRKPALSPRYPPTLPQNQFSNGPGIQQETDKTNWSGVQKEWKTDETVNRFDYEKQPVGGKNAEMHRRLTLQGRSHSHQQGHQHLQVQNPGTNYYPPSSDAAWPSVQSNMESFPVNMPELKQNTQVYHENKNNRLQVQQQEVIAQQVQANRLTGPGMTSPQDLRIGQSLTREQWNNFGYPMNPHSWVINNQGGQQRPMQYQYAQGPMHPTTMQPQFQSQVQSQEEPYWQYQTNHPHRQYPATQQVVSPNQKWDRQFNQQYVQQQVGKRPPQFTQEMIRDQEVLLTTMRQQRIPEDLMRRQFEALLNEQRKHLTYMQQTQQDANDNTSKPAPFVHRKITKILEDGKPEWMMHITPPRMSYRDFERMKKNQEDSDKKVIRYADAQRSNLQQNANAVQDQQVQLQTSQVQSQVHPCQTWPGQYGDWQCRTEMPPPPYNFVKGRSSSLHYPQNVQYFQTTENHPHHLTYQSQMYDQSVQQYQYPRNIQYFNNQQQFLQDQQMWQNWYLQQQERQSNMTHSTEADTSSKNVEPSSLLKLRKYKEVICPQKRNNGLQDPEKIREALEALNRPENRRGLEYLANLNKKEVSVRLNGTQHPGQVPPELVTAPPRECYQQKLISANGLENTRNPNNPAPAPTLPRNVGEPILEYPRQKLANQTRHCYQVAERENGTTSSALQHYQGSMESQFQSSYGSPGIQNFSRNKLDVARCNERNSMMVHNVAGQLRIDENQPQFYQQPSQGHFRQDFNVYNNGQGDASNPKYVHFADQGNKLQGGGDAAGAAGNMISHNLQQIRNFNHNQDICEPRMIGGVTYFARRPSHMKNVPVSPHRFADNKYLHPPTVVN